MQCWQSWCCWPCCSAPVQLLAFLRPPLVVPGLLIPELLALATLPLLLLAQLPRRPRLGRRCGTRPPARRACVGEQDLQKPRVQQRNPRGRAPLQQILVESTGKTSCSNIEYPCLVPVYDLKGPVFNDRSGATLNQLEQRRESTDAAEVRQLERAPKRAEEVVDHEQGAERLARQRPHEALQIFGCRTRQEAPLRRNEPRQPLVLGHGQLYIFCGRIVV